MLLDRDHHVRQHRRAARPGQREQVREAGGHQAKVGARAMRPFFLEREAAAAGDIDRHQGAGHRVEASGVDDRVERQGLIFQVDAGLGDRLYGLGAQVHQPHIGPVVGGEVAGVQAGPLGADRVVAGAQQPGQLGVADLGADFFAHHLGDDGVGLGKEDLVGEDVQDRDQFAGRPSGLEALAFELGRREAAHHLGGRVRHARARPFAGMAVGAAVGLPGGAALGRHRPVAGRDRVVGGALEHRQRAGLGCDHRDRLDARRASADHCNPLA